MAEMYRRLLVRTRETVAELRTERSQLPKIGPARLRQHFPRTLKVALEPTRRLQRPMAAGRVPHHFERVSATPREIHHAPWSDVFDPFVVDEESIPTLEDEEELLFPMMRVRRRTLAP